MKTSWWLDYSAVPDRLLWARLQVLDSGEAVVLDLDGRVNRFISKQEAVDWLSEDEYTQLSHLIEDGEVPADTLPPQAENDVELVSLMSPAGPSA